MPIFYKGAGPATYWHQNNAIDDGFVSCKPGHIPSDDLMIDHIINGNTNSPYISLTRSFGVALNYAMFGEEAMADENDPGYVYEIEIAEPLPDGLVLIDPVKQLAQSLPSPTASETYHHDGLPDVLLGVVDPAIHGDILFRPVPLPSSVMSNKQPPSISRRLRTFINAMRDAEILAVGNIPKSYVLGRRTIKEIPNSVSITDTK